VKGKLRKLHGDEERKERKGKKESAARKLQQASISTCASSATGYKVALIFYSEGSGEDGQKAAGEDAGKFQGKHGRKGKEPTACGSPRLPLVEVWAQTGTQSRRLGH